MITRIKKKRELTPFFTDKLLENGYGVVIADDMPKSSYLAIDIDKYYHKSNINPTPEIADTLLVAQRLSAKGQYHIYIVEMKNIKSPQYFKIKNIYEKFNTAVEDFMKRRYADIFLDDTINVTNFRLLFITDAYRLKKRGVPDKAIRSFLMGTKIEFLQNMPPFSFRNFTVVIDYQLPNTLLSWK
jgi:hypothetical protein